MSVLRIGTLSHNALDDRGTLSHAEIEARLDGLNPLADLQVAAPLALDLATSELSVAAASGAQSGVVTTAAQTFAGAKTFLNQPVCDAGPVAASHLVNKGYADSLGLGMDWQPAVVAFHEFADGKPVPPIADGARYIALSTFGVATAHHIYTWSADDDDFDETAPVKGWALYVASAASPQFAEQNVLYNGAEWVALGSSLSHQSLIGAGTLSHADIDGMLDQDVRAAASPSWPAPTVSNVDGYYSFTTAGGVQSGIRRVVDMSAGVQSDTTHPTIVSHYRAPNGNVPNPGGPMRWRHAAFLTEGGIHNSSVFGLLVDVVAGNPLEGAQYGLAHRAVELTCAGGWQHPVRPAIIALSSLGVQHETIAEADRGTRAFLSLKPGNTVNAQYGTLTYYQNVDSNDAAYIRFGNTRDSLSATTGGAVFDGGVGVAKSLRVGTNAGVGGNLTTGGLLRVNSAEAATSAATGAAVVAGGLGVGGDIYTGGVLRAAANTPSTTPATGAAVVSGGLGVGGDVTTGGAVSIESSAASTSSETGALKVAGGVGVGGRANIGGRVVIEDGTGSVSPETGALVVAGGVGVGGALRVTGFTKVGSRIEIANATAATASTGAVLTSGGISARGGAYIDGDTKIAAGTNSSSAATGALVVAGGVGVGGSVNVAGDVACSHLGAANMSCAAAPVADTDVVRKMDVAVLTPGIGEELTLGAADYSTDNPLTLRGGVSTASNTKAHLTLKSKVGRDDEEATITIRNGPEGVTLAVTGMPVAVRDTTESDSTASGALVVRGGAGVAKDLNVGGAASTKSLSVQEDAVIPRIIAGSIAKTTTPVQITAASGTPHIELYSEKTVNGVKISVTSTLAADAERGLVVSPGGDTIVEGNTRITSTSQADDLGSGALAVSGGASISKDLHIGGDIFLHNDYEVSGFGWCHDQLDPSRTVAEQTLVFTRIGDMVFLSAPEMSEMYTVSTHSNLVHEYPLAATEYIIRRPQYFSAYALRNAEPEPIPVTLLLGGGDLKYEIRVINPQMSPGTRWWMLPWSVYYRVGYSHHTPS
jgi:hypothetical protein